MQKSQLEKQNKSHDKVPVIRPFSVFVEMVTISSFAASLLILPGPGLAGPVLELLGGQGADLPPHGAGEHHVRAARGPRHGRRGGARELLEETQACRRHTPGWSR